VAKIITIEYHSAQPPAAVHGNAKKIKMPYTRTPASTMDKVKQAAVHDLSKAVYNDCILSMDSDDAPRNLQSVRSAKCYQRQKVRREPDTASFEFHGRDSASNGHGAKRHLCS